VSIISLIKQGLNATEELATLPFALTRELAGDRNNTSGRVLRQVSQIGQRAVTMPLRFAKNLLEDQEGGREQQRQRQQDQFQSWHQDYTDQFEQLGRS